jgi:spore coat polysaccharide biosynthesis predicted glycosyltransferase SpsG
MAGLIIVPARAGSVGVPGKNVRSIAGVPTIAWAIEKLETVVHNAEVHLDERISVVVASDDEDILFRALLHSRYRRSTSRPSWILPVQRPPEQATADQTIHELVAWVLPEIQHLSDGEFPEPDWIGIHPRSSPTLTAQTMFDMVCDFLARPDLDSMQTGIADHSFRWSERGGMDPPHRVNRQDRRPEDERWAETGGFHLVRGWPWEGTPAPTIGKVHEFHVVQKSEAIDIDTPMDWAAAETVLDRPTVAILTGGTPATGSGHLRRAVSLAQALIPYAATNIWCWNTPKTMREAAGISGSNITADGLEALWDLFDVVVVDVLDALNLDLRPITASHPGKTIRLESATIDPHSQPINGLYAFPTGSCGPDWVDIRDEFKYLPPYLVATTLDKILVSMGGVDPAGLSVPICNLLAALPAIDGAHISLVAPPAGTFDAADLHDRVEVLENPSMAWEMSTHDLLICSRGRTQFEAAHVGIPTIAIPVNAREYHEHVSPDGVEVIKPLWSGADPYDPLYALPELPNAVQALSAAWERRARSMAGQAAVDGHGMDRIVERVLQRAREQRRRRAPHTLGLAPIENPDNEGNQQ